MDLNLKWQASQWLFDNITDILLWAGIATYCANSILKNVPEAKADTGFQAFCNVVNSLYSGIKNLTPVKRPGGTDAN